MRHPSFWFVAPACASILALALSGCGGTQSALPGTNGAGQSELVSPLKKPAPPKLSAKPAQLNFATAPTMKLTVSEKSYKGKFKLKVTPAHLIKIKGTGKGPTAKFTVTALKAGSGKILVTDDQGGKKSVPFSVTQGVIIIQ
jgi:hypothetical protein